MIPDSSTSTKGAESPLLLLPVSLPNVIHPFHLSVKPGKAHELANWFGAERWESVCGCFLRHWICEAPELGMDMVWLFLSQVASSWLWLLKSVKCGKFWHGWPCGQFIPEPYKEGQCVELLWLFSHGPLDSSIPAHTVTNDLGEGNQLDKVEDGKRLAVLYCCIDQKTECSGLVWVGCQKSWVHRIKVKSI